jgi:putative intracellular protease/amidase
MTEEIDALYVIGGVNHAEADDFDKELVKLVRDVYKDGT